MIIANYGIIVFQLIERIVLNIFKMLKDVRYCWCNEAFAIPALKARHEVPIEPHL